MAAATPSFRPEVEGLRAVAVVLVFANHLFGDPVGGFTGVDVFFVISGFLITGLLHREYQRTGRISIKNFYARRARRILPGAVLVLLATLAAARVLFYSARAHSVSIDSAWAAGFLANVHFARVGTDYFHANRPQSPVQHFWSLSVEEQFYVVWPLLLFAMAFLAAKVFRRFAVYVLATVVGALTVVFFVIAVQQTTSNSATAYFATTARAWELGVGALLAVALSGRVSLPRWVRAPSLVLGAAMVAYSAAFVTGSNAFPAPAAIYAVLGASLIIVSGTGSDLGVLAAPLTNPVSRYIGRVSYSLYLWHWPVIVFLPAVMSRRGGYFDVTAILLAAAVTSVSYHFVEDPIRRMDFARAGRLVFSVITRRGPRSTGKVVQRTEHRGFVALYAVCMFVFALVAMALQPVASARVAAPLVSDPVTAATALPAYVVDPPATIASGVTQALGAYTFPKLNPSINDVADAHGPEWKTCGNVSAATLARCTFPAKGNGPAKTLVVLGDSFGIAWTPTMRAAQADGYTVVELTHSQCPMIDANFREDIGKSNQFTAECNAARNYYVSEIARLKPDIVVIGNYDAMLNELASHAKGQAALQEWGVGARKIIARVKAAGAKRVVWMTSPPPSADLATCAQSPSATPAQCVSPVGFTWTQTRIVEVAAVKAEGAVMLDTSLFFCDSNGNCPAFVGTTPTHTEGHHLTGRYAAMIGPYIVPYVLGTKTTAA